MKKKPYYDTKIGKIIDQYGDSRFQFTMFTYILNHGISKLKTYTEEQILTIKGENVLPDDLVQGVVRCAVEISKQCGIYEILRYIKEYL